MSASTQGAPGESWHDDVPVAVCRRRYRRSAETASAYINEKALILADAAGRGIRLDRSLRNRLQRYMRTKPALVHSTEPGAIQGASCLGLARAQPIYEPL